MINIAEILKDVPKGTKLYSPMAGEVFLEEVNTHNIEVRISKNGGYLYLTPHGCFCDFSDAECQLFPSKTQRDWTKFKAWLKFPTSLEECHDILGLARMIEEDQYRDDEIEALRQLLSARDAWWKVDGWKPDWEDTTLKFGIAYSANQIYNFMSKERQRIIAFRTAEIRDKFLETYRDLIEKCKELI